LKSRLLEVIDRDYAENVIYLPVQEQRVIARIRKIGVVLSEDYLSVSDDRDSIEQPLVRLRFRTSRKHRKEVEPIVDRFREFGPEEPR